MNLLFSCTENVKIERRQLLQCVVKAINKTRAIVHLSSDEDLLSKSIVRQITINALIDLYFDCDLRNL